MTAAAKRVVFGSPTSVIAEEINEDEDIHERGGHSALRHQHNPLLDRYNKSQ